MDMSTSQVLDKFKGMSCDFLYYLEKTDFIHPKKLTRGKLDRRLYSEDDVEKIGLIWQYYKRGISPKEACKKAEEILTGDASSAQNKLKEAMERAHAKGIELSGMSLESFAGILGDKNDVLIDDLTRMIDDIIEEKHAEKNE